MQQALACMLHVALLPGGARRGRAASCQFDAMRGNLFHIRTYHIIYAFKSVDLPLASRLARIVSQHSIV